MFGLAAMAYEPLNHNTFQKTALKIYAPKYARWVVKIRVSIKELDHELEISIAW